MNYLGIDYGKNKIGLAFSQGNIAAPFSVISGKNWQGKIKNIIQKENIDKIIVGISENIMAEETKKFAQEVEKITGIKVELFDETLTTHDAMQKMIESGKSKKFRKEKKDSFAASLILQSYLDNLV